MSTDERAAAFDKLRRVIAWEIKAQAGIHRPVEQWPLHIADTVLDYFDVSMKPGADVSGLE
jgi:hypothetical protein